MKIDPLFGWTLKLIVSALPCSNSTPLLSWGCQDQKLHTGLSEFGLVSYFTVGLLLREEGGDSGGLHVQEFRAETIQSLSCPDQQTWRSCGAANQSYLQYQINVSVLHSISLENSRELSETVETATWRSRNLSLLYAASPVALASKLRGMGLKRREGRGSKSRGKGFKSRGKGFKFTKEGVQVAREGALFTKEGL